MFFQSKVSMFKLNFYLNLIFLAEEISVKININKVSEMNRGDNQENKPFHEVLQEVDKEASKCLIENGVFF